MKSLIERLGQLSEAAPWAKDRSQMSGGALRADLRKHIKGLVAEKVLRGSDADEMIAVLDRYTPKSEDAETAVPVTESMAMFDEDDKQNPVIFVEMSGLGAVYSILRRKKKISFEKTDRPNWYKFTFEEP